MQKPWQLSVQNSRGLRGHKSWQATCDRRCQGCQGCQGSGGCRRGANRQLSEKSRVDRSSHWYVAPLQSHSWDLLVMAINWGNSTPAELQIVEARHCDDGIPRQLTFLNHLLLIVFPLSPFPASMAGLFLWWSSPCLWVLNRNWNTLKCQPEPRRITIYYNVEFPKWHKLKRVKMYVPSIT